jgi:hypothetical protein
MWIWTNSEKYVKLLKVVQKWLSLASDVEINDTVTSQTTDIAYERMQSVSEKIVKELHIEDTNSEAFIMSWIQVGFFCGFLVGWKSAYDVVIPDIEDQGIDFDTDLNTYAFANQIEPYARDYAEQTSTNIFEKLLTPPVSPLLVGLEESNIEFLKITTENSIFAGYTDGFELAHKTNSIVLDS